ncbi:MAG: hypothetical protein L7F78_00500 [Syntrophales bacterium LBB04]|nr:hypothetical protein [Syntrophales bacterium LBB04]
MCLLPDPSVLKKSQAAWLNEKRNVSDNQDDIEAANLTRIEEIRLEPKLKKKLFADTDPPVSIFGRYSKTEPLCFNPKKGSDEYDCEPREVEDYFDLKPGSGHSVKVKGELWSLNGNQCGPFEGEAEWIYDTLRLPNLDDEEVRCVLLMRFKDGKIFTEYPASLCKSVLCGANAGFHGIDLPKLTTIRTDGTKSQTKQLSSFLNSANFNF